MAYEMKNIKKRSHLGANSRIWKKIKVSNAKIICHFPNGEIVFSEDSQSCAKLMQQQPVFKNALSPGMATYVAKYVRAFEVPAAV